MPVRALEERQGEQYCRKHVAGYNRRKPMFAVANRLAMEANAGNGNELEGNHIREAIRQMAADQKRMNVGFPKYLRFIRHKKIWQLGQGPPPASEGKKRKRDPDHCKTTPAADAATVNPLSKRSQRKRGPRKSQRKKAKPSDGLPDALRSVDTSSEDTGTPAHDLPIIDTPTTTPSPSSTNSSPPADAADAASTPTHDEINKKKRKRAKRTKPANTASQNDDAEHDTSLRNTTANSPSAATDRPVQTWTTATLDQLPQFSTTVTFDEQPQTSAITTFTQPPPIWTTTLLPQTPKTSATTTFDRPLQTPATKTVTKYLEIGNVKNTSAEPPTDPLKHVTDLSATLDVVIMKRQTLAAKLVKEWRASAVRLLEKLGCKCEKDWRSNTTATQFVDLGILESELESKLKWETRPTVTQFAAMSLRLRENLGRPLGRRTLVQQFEELREHIVSIQKQLKGVDPANLLQTIYLRSLKYTCAIKAEEKVDLRFSSEAHRIYKALGADRTFEEIIAWDPQRMAKHLREILKNDDELNRIQERLKDHPFVNQYLMKHEKLFHQNWRPEHGSAKKYNYDGHRQAMRTSTKVLKAEYDEAVAELLAQL
ncbi:hypothetical protein HK097_008219 [Rhizophlyctis rosea]|uniref:Uncharacterized protein n=1 Tax=Rhizophlyctis rosea TaxID=64517 RepID=A0AAD5X428_9FUNG|nr:hypothetical protein HK097_008219 [Rhizophlyctis rosea]